MSQLDKILQKISEIQLPEQYKKIINSVLSENNIQVKEENTSDFNDLLRSIPRDIIIEYLSDNLSDNIPFGNSYDAICFTLQEKLWWKKPDKFSFTETLKRQITEASYHFPFFL